MNDQYSEQNKHQADSNNDYYTNSGEFKDKKMVDELFKER